MDNIIMTVGTSLVENYIANNPKKENITKEDILRYYEEEKIEDLRDRRYGAEVIALENLLEKGIFSGDRIFLVIHNTVNGKLAGDVLEEFILAKKIAKRVEKRIIFGLDKRNHEVFRTEGLTNLTEEIRNMVNKIGNKYNVAVCTVGGYKAEIFMVGLMAQLLHIKSYFMFDEFTEVTEISPLPIKADQNIYLENKEFFRLLDRVGKVKLSEVKKELDSKIDLNNFIEFVEENGETYVRFSSMGEYYVRRMRETSYLPPASMISHAPAGKIMEGSVHVEELEGIVNSLSTCSYVEKLKVVYYNPDRKVAFSKFALAQNYHEQMIITLEYKCKKGVARVDVYTVGGTEKEMDSLVAYFNENFLD